MSIHKDTSKIDVREFANMSGVALATGRVGQPLPLQYRRLAPCRS